MAENENHLSTLVEATSKFTLQVSTQSGAAIEALNTLVTESGTALSTVGRRLEEQLRHFREQLTLDHAGNRESVEADRQNHLDSLAEISVAFASEVQRQQGEIRASVERILPALESGFSDLDNRAQSFADMLARIDGSLVPTRESMANLETSAKSLAAQLGELGEKAALPDAGVDGQGTLSGGPQDGRPGSRSIISRLFGRSAEDDAHSTP